MASLQSGVWRTREIQLVQIQGYLLPTLPSDEHHGGSANARVVHRIVRVQPLPLAIWPSELGFETHDSLLDADLVFMWFLAEACEERGDGGSSECGPEGIEHGRELEIGEGVCIVGIVLLQILAPELLAKGVVGLVLGSVGLIHGYEARRMTRKKKPT